MDDDNPFESDNPFGFMNDIGSMFDLDVDDELSDGTETAIRVHKAADAVNELAEYIEEHDIEMEELTPHETVELDPGEHAVVMATASLGQALERFAEVTDSDDDDDNPFKVSDGDDPVY